MYVNDVVFCVWIVATIFALFILVAWLVIKICGFIRDTKFGISQLKERVHILEESKRNDFKYIKERIDNIEANKCKGEKDEVD